MAALVVAAIAKLWPSFLLAPWRLAPFKAAVAQEVRSHAQASGALAIRQYRQQRQAAGETSAYQPTIATLPSVEDIAAMVEEALAGVQLDAPEAPAADTGALADAKARLAAGAEDLVFETGARTVLENVTKDRKARGYARIPEANACSFCLLLAIRGAVFKKDRSTGKGRGVGDSFAASNKTKTNGKVPSSIKVHDNCRCQPEPVFGVYEAPARVREAEQTYKDAIAPTEEAPNGFGGANARLRFRQAVEGRAVTGGETKTKTTKGTPRKAPTRQTPGERTREQIQAELTALEKRLPGLTTDKQREWMTNRIAALRQQLTK